MSTRNALRRSATGKVVDTYGSIPGGRDPLAREVIATVLMDARWAVPVCLQMPLAGAVGWTLVPGKLQVSIAGEVGSCCLPVSKIGEVGRTLVPT